MAIQRATSDDIEGIRRVARQSWRTDYPEILSRETAEEAVEEWYDPDRLEEEIKSDDALISVFETEDGNEIAGFAHIVWDARTGTVLRLYVAPDHRGRRIGTDLLAWTVDALADRDVERVRALVLSENEPGNAFYRSFGFEKTGEGRTTIGDDTYRENTYSMPV